MSVALWIVLLVCVLWIALSEMPAGWDGHLPLPYLIALTPLLWIPTLVIAIAGAVRHDTALAIVAAIACIASLLRKINNLTSINTAQMVADNIAKKRETSCGTHTSTAAEAAKHGRFRVMTLNCRYGRANAAAIVSAVKEHDVAVLAPPVRGEQRYGQRRLQRYLDSHRAKRHVADYRRDSRRRRAWRVLPD